MNSTIIIAIILIAAGVLVFAYQGIAYTTRANVGDLGRIQALTEKFSGIPWPLVMGTVALIGGLLCWSREVVKED